MTQTAKQSLEERTTNSSESKEISLTQSKNQYSRKYVSSSHDRWHKKLRSDNPLSIVYSENITSLPEPKENYFI